MSVRRRVLLVIVVFATFVAAGLAACTGDDGISQEAPSPATSEERFDVDTAAERWTALDAACAGDPAACDERDDLSRTIYNETSRLFLRAWLHGDRVAVESLTDDEVLAGEVGFNLDQLLRYLPDENQFECVDGRSPVGLGCYVAVTTLDGNRIDLYLTFTLTAGRSTLTSWAPDV